MERILTEINKRIIAEYELPYTSEFKILLNSLNSREKSFVANYFIKAAWNIGSLDVLSILQETHILTATKYILSHEDNEITESDHIQLVLADFLEVQFVLLENIITNAFSNSLKLRALLEVCICRLLKDLEINHNSIGVNYLHAIKEKVEERVYTSFKILHLNSLLSLHEVGTKTAFGEIENWIKNIPEKNYYEILKELVVNDGNILENYLLQQADSTFKHWKYFVILIYIGNKHSRPDYRKTIKTHLRTLFKKFIESKTKQLYLSLLIVGRVICLAESDDIEISLEKYAQWYKSLFSDMKYLMTIECFKEVMNILIESVEFENNSTFLKIHGNTSINAPTLCNSIVLQYKNDCKKKCTSLDERLNASKSVSEQYESIVIDDD